MSLIASHWLLTGTCLHCPEQQDTIHFSVQPSQLTRLFLDLEKPCWVRGAEQEAVEEGTVPVSSGSVFLEHTREEESPDNNLQTTSQQKSQLKKKKNPGSKTLAVYLKYHFGFFDSVVSHKEGKKSWLIAALCLWKNVKGNSLLSNSHHATDTAPLLWQCSPWCPWCSKGYLLFQENDTLEAASVQDNYRQDWQKQEGPGNPPLEKKKRLDFTAQIRSEGRLRKHDFFPQGELSILI